MYPTLCERIISNFLRADAIEWSVATGAAVPTQVYTPPSLLHQSYQPTWEFLTYNGRYFPVLSIYDYMASGELRKVPPGLSNASCWPAEGEREIEQRELRYLVPLVLQWTTFSL